MTGITRCFARVVANDNVSLSVADGEVHAIVGENGAGKSTLMKILYGLYQPDSGTIRVNGSLSQFRSPADAIAAGIGMVHQHFMLVPPFTVAENVILGEEPASVGFVSREAAAARVAELAERYRLAVDPRAVVADLGVGEQQRVEILKILYRNARIVILDEPTAVLTPQEVDALFVTIRELQSAGKTIIIITHKLREVMALSRRLTVLRDGRNVAVLETAGTSPEEIARLMVGRDVVLPGLAREIRKMRSPDDSTIESAGARAELCSPTALDVVDLCLKPQKGIHALHQVSFSVAPGEILGIAGVEGNGQAELLDCLTGLRAATSGSILLDRHDVTRLSPRRKFAAGLACIPEDRQRKGLILDFNLRENLSLGRHRERGIGCRLSSSRAAAMLEEFDVRPPQAGLKASHLSGGNQQKLIVAREFTRDARVLIAAQPTRGIDLGAVEFIHGKLLGLRSRNMAILLVSAELSEILALSDRIAVMYDGRIVFAAPNRNLTEHDLGIWMAGGHPPQAAPC